MCCSLKTNKGRNLIFMIRKQLKGQLQIVLLLLLLLLMVFVKVGTHEGTCCRVMSRGQIPSCKRSIFMKNLVAGTKFCPRDMSPEFRSVWIEGTCRVDKTTKHARSPRLNCSCNMSPGHLRKITNQKTSFQFQKALHWNLSLQHTPSCEQRMKFFPATCPCSMSPRVCRPLV